MQERKLIPVERYRNIEKWAVIVGISEYQYKPSWNLNYAHRDAEELYKLLQSNNYGNFPPNNIKLLINQQATTRNIRKALNTFLKRPNSEDLVLIYFACHGAPDFDLPENKYLLTHDTEHDDISGTALEMEAINSALKKTIKAEKVIILADTCHSGGINYRDINNVENRSINDNSDQVTRYLQQLNNSKGGIAIVTSAEATQLSQEGKQWDDAKEFCHKLSQQTGREYRLPSEAEWEYAARAGTKTPFYFGATITGKLANYNTSKQYAAEATEKSQEKTTKVGIFPPNDFGLYDMHGNVWEWCEDDWHENYNGAPIDGSAWLSNKSSIKVVRGGCWVDDPDFCRSSCRNDFARVIRDYSRFGFRVVCVAGRII